MLPPGETSEGLSGKPISNHDLEFFVHGEQLINLIREGKIERFAQHFDPSDFHQMLNFFGFTLIEGSYEDRIWKTRSGNPLPGFVALYRKTSSLDSVDPMLCYLFTHED